MYHRQEPHPSVHAEPFWGGKRLSSYRCAALRQLAKEHGHSATLLIGCMRPFAADPAYHNIFPGKEVRLHRLLGGPSLNCRLSLFHLKGSLLVCTNMWCEDSGREQISQSQASLPPILLLPLIAPGPHAGTTKGTIRNPLSSWTQAPNRPRSLFAFHMGNQKDA